MNCNRIMNCPLCGSVMIFKKFCDYGGYSYGWKCPRCGDIIDEYIENSQQEGRKQKSFKTLSDETERRGRIKLNLST
ncbi:MAG: hypothetical protein JW755_04605 [Candidatus Aminicenantes bacterium]|nr:hypothetical protein [Candidatus Aminicenantes bacterium]